eukprot:364749-Chlamydomonas_euryale.AAC.8
MHLNARLNAASIYLHSWACGRRSLADLTLLSYALTLDPSRCSNLMLNATGMNCSHSQHTKMFALMLKPLGCTAILLNPSRRVAWMLTAPGCAALVINPPGQRERRTPPPMREPRWLMSHQPWCKTLCVQAGVSIESECCAGQTRPRDSNSHAWLSHPGKENVAARLHAAAVNMEKTKNSMLGAPLRNAPSGSLNPCIPLPLTAELDHCPRPLSPDALPTAAPDHSLRPLPYNRCPHTCGAVTAVPTSSYMRGCDGFSHPQWAEMTVLTHTHTRSRRLSL